LATNHDANALYNQKGFISEYIFTAYKYNKLSIFTANINVENEEQGLQAASRLIGNTTTQTGSQTKCVWQCAKKIKT